MSKELIVLAECVDSRNGNRFQPGDVFEPAPSVDQAGRLVRAGCLPVGAIDEAGKTAGQQQKNAEKAAAEREKAGKLADAQAKVDAAQAAVADAEAKASTASAAEKSAAKDAFDIATRDLKQATELFASLSK